MRVCLVTPAYRYGDDSSGRLILVQFIKIFQRLCDKVFVLSGEFEETFSAKNVQLVRTASHTDTRIALKILKYGLSELRISWHMLKLRHQVDCAIFVLHGTPLLTPIVTAKLLQKKTISICGGSGTKSIAHWDTFFSKKVSVLPRVMSLLEGLHYRLCDKVVVYSPNAVSQLGLDKHLTKTLPSGSFFIDMELFQHRVDLGQRRNLVGYIGRLSEEKGIMNLALAIPLVLNRRTDVEFLICGDGVLRHQAEEDLRAFKPTGKVIFAGWIPHDEVSDCLNQMKLLVLPSYTEELPATLLEAMACGTPVLATPVGSIPAVIKDGGTGFIMEESSPQCIAANVDRALNHPNLDDIATKGRALVEERYSYDAAVRRYRDILSTLMNERAGET